ncbi:hypothetical protein QFC22_005279 [Naganishia vaughanmartiniae]|uniref:Uncharacterized protein n=1 Tax=Naganishia vaughanmartiniae TaxID=1424756 RepID=A0ACC2WWJ0_9TREE|nr:hypothetical protein QFC22_005279 [Naganishia vaughanmartiniae]
MSTTSNAKANYSYPLSRYPRATLPPPANHLRAATAAQQLEAKQHEASTRGKKATQYGSSRSTSARTSAQQQPPNCFVLPSGGREMSKSGATFSLETQSRSTAIPPHDGRRGHTRKDSRFDDAFEEGCAGVGVGVGGKVEDPSRGRKPLAPISINIQPPDQEQPRLLPLPKATKPPSLTPSTRNYSLASYTANKQTHSSVEGKAPTSPKPRKQEQHTPNRLRKPNTNTHSLSPGLKRAKPAVPATRRGAQTESRMDGKRSSWKIGAVGVGTVGAAKKTAEKEEPTGAQVIPSLRHAFEPSNASGAAAVSSSFRSRIPLPVQPEGTINSKVDKDKADMVSMKSLALSIASDPFADPRARIGKKGSVASLGRRKENIVPEAKEVAGFSNTKAVTYSTTRPQHGHDLPIPPVPSAPYSSAAPPPVISKKKSTILGFSTSLAAQGKNDHSSSTGTAVGKRIGGLVKMPSGGFGLRRPANAKHGGEAAGNISFSSGRTGGDDDADTSVVDASMMVREERQSMDSNFSMMSDWTITNFSDISADLPGFDRAQYHGPSEEQNGGVFSAGALQGKQVRKKKSFAAAGVFLGKILHGAGEKKERRKSEVAIKELPRQLRNEASTMTLRPSDPSVENISDTDKPGHQEAHIRGRSPSPTPTSRSKDTRPFQAILNQTPTALAPSSDSPAFYHATHSYKPAQYSGCNRAKSPELPSLHFPKLSYTGTNFRADLSLVGNALEMAPPVPPIPATFSSPVGNTVRQEPRLRVANPDAQSSRTLASEYANSALRAGVEAKRSAHGLQPSLDYSQYNQEESGESSLVHVEHALDTDDEYSFISKNSSIINGGEERFSGKLPWRRSVQGVFTIGENDARRDESHVLVDRLLESSSLDKRPSLMDLKKVSNMTGSLQALVAAYSASPSTLKDFEENPIDGEEGNNDTGMVSDPAVRLDSPSSSHIMDHDSPTPMRKYGYDRHGKASRLMTPQLGASPLRISPLRLALGNSTTKSQQESRTDEKGTHLSRRIFEDNPFLTSKKAAVATFGTTAPPAKTLGDELALSRQRRRSSVSSSDEDESPLARRIDNTGDSLGLPPLPNAFIGNTRASKDTQDTVSSLDGDAFPRESFDFTEEYRALNENGSRQSFMDEMERLGLSSGEESFRIEGSGLGDGARVKRGTGADTVSSHSGATTRETAGHARRNSYGFDKNFRFGITKQVSCSMLSSGCSNSVNQVAAGGISSPPKEPLPIPQPSLGTNARFRFKPNPEDSMFSIATMSSVGPVVDTGIAGTEFVNVFDRDFGDLLAARDRTYRSLHHQSSNTSSIDSFSNGPTHFRRPSHARISSFASATSRSDSLQHARGDAGHHRQQSSLDSSNRSIIRKVGRPNLDSDRMFETDTRKRLYSIQGSPTALSARNPPDKPSKDSILDSSRYLTTRDSILDSTQDSIFRSGTQKAKLSTFAIKPIRPLSHISDATEPTASLSPLGIKIRMRHNAADDSLFDDSVRDPIKQEEEEEAVEHCLQVDTEVSNEDTSLTSNLSIVSGGLRRPARPKNARSSRPSSLLFANPGLPALLSPEHSEFSSHKSTDVHSIISTMVEGETNSRWSRRLKGLSQLSEQGVTIAKSVPLASGIVNEEQVSPRSGKKSGLTRWVDFQRLVEAEVTKSKTTWQDSLKSVEVLSGFVPPSSAEGIRSVIRNSLDLSRPLCEASPGTQIARREQHEIEGTMKPTAPGCGVQELPVTKPLALPTKFMRADSAKAGGRSNDGSPEAASTRPVSVIFAKFAIPSEPAPTASDSTSGPLVVKPKDTAIVNAETRTAKSPIRMRSRVNSTARRVSPGVRG